MSLTAPTLANGTDNPLTPFAYNSTLINNGNLCTFETCPVSWAASRYRPSLPGNAFYCSIFGLCLAVQVFLGVRHRTWGYMSGMIGGCILEVAGYIGRIMIYNNQFDGQGFLLQITTLTIAPAFIAASIYLCLSRIVIVYGKNISRFSPRTYTLFFISCDIISLFIQAAGAVTTSMSNQNANTQNAAINVMVAGIAFQVVSLALFLATCAEFWFRVRRAEQADLNPTFAHVRRSLWFRALLWVLAISTLTVFTRSVFRCAELKDGFQGRLANDQVTFMVLEGAMVAIAVILMTAVHPGIAFQGNWNNATWFVRKKNEVKERMEMQLVEMEGAK